MSKLVVTGCSASSGYGFNPENPWSDFLTAPDLWVNMLYQQLPRLQHYQLDNLARGGLSNSEIFETTVDAISSSDGSVTELWCQWTGLFRWNFDAGFELYSTSTGTAIPKPLEIRTNQYVLTEKFLKNFFNEYRSVIHPHQEICKILKYVNIINKLCYNRNIKVCHISAGCPWDANYFVRLSGPDITPNDYTTYTKEKILFVNNRDDNEIFQLYDKLHNDYEPLIAQQEHTWLNLNTSLYSQKISNDYNFDNRHPGSKSNQKFFDLLYPLLA